MLLDVSFRSRSIQYLYFGKLRKKTKQKLVLVSLGTLILLPDCHTVWFLISSQILCNSPHLTEIACQCSINSYSYSYCKSWWWRGGGKVYQQSYKAYPPDTKLRKTNPMAVSSLLWLYLLGFVCQYFHSDFFFPMGLEHIILSHASVFLKACLISVFRALHF